MEVNTGGLNFNARPPPVCGIMVTVTRLQLLQRVKRTPRSMQHTIRAREKASLLRLEYQGSCFSGFPFFCSLFGIWATPHFAVAVSNPQRHMSRRCNDGSDGVVSTNQSKPRHDVCGIQALRDRNKKHWINPSSGKTTLDFLVQDFLTTFWSPIHR